MKPLTNAEKSKRFRDNKAKKGLKAVRNVWAKEEKHETIKSVANANDEEFEQVKQMIKDWRNT